MNPRNGKYQKHGENCTMRNEERGMKNRLLLSKLVPTFSNTMVSPGQRGGFPTAVI
jgi:hypothetical protein